MMTMVDGVLPFNGSIGGRTVGKVKNIPNRLKRAILAATVYAGLLLNRTLQGLHLGISFVKELLSPIVKK